VGEINLELSEVLDRVGQGDQEAATWIVRQYTGCIRQVVDRTLKHCLRRQFDVVDLVQDVFLRFFTDHVHRYVFPTATHLRAFLRRAAHNLVVDATRGALAARKHNCNDQLPLDSPDVPEAALVSNVPSAQRVVLAREQWEQLLADLPDNNARAAFRLYAEGHSYEEIGQVMGGSDRTVRRLFMHSRRFFKEHLSS
jgi:RNA polymerase sigma factor (sigma-70 family)